MDPGVLANLERGQVEPECRDLPAEIRQLPPGDARQVVGDEGCLEHGEVRVEGRGIAVAARARRRLAGEPRARAAQALGDRAQVLAIRLVREPPAQVAGRLAQVLRVADEGRVQRPVQARGGEARRDGLHQPGADGLVAAQEMVRLEAGGLEGHVGGHARMAIAVRPDPRAEAEQGGCLGRPRSRPARIGRDGPVGGAVGRRVQPVERAVHGALEARHRHEQRLVEDRELRPHLVERGRRDRAELGRVPQERDLLAQAASDVGVLVGGDQRVVEVVQQPPDPTLGDQQRPPPGLGRVGGQDRVDPGSLEDRGHRRPIVLGTEGRDGLADGFGDGAPLGAPGPRAQGADPLPFLGQVDQLEVDGERPAHGGELVEGQGGDLGIEPAPFRIGLDGDRRVAAPEGDHPPADPLDEQEQPPAGLLGDDLAEQRSQEANLPPHRVAGAPETGPRRLGGDRREPGIPGTRGLALRGAVGGG